ncbi:MULTISPECIES: hypothetical protein [Mycobacteroides]|uniref:hypothetical protein n=1 Tax=Mycobacteroides TaxID=670516 RepID=UPI00092BB7A9|nr:MULTISPECIES: hypothetical protein [Mycobacteroides]SIM96630.1 Uncharacterised protein [Mycobacteroides abscessus subsp. abscessus]
MSPMRHGDAERISQMCADLGLSMPPWQRQLLDDCEQRDLDAQFDQIARSLTE